MSHYILDKAYTVMQSGGVSAFRVVAQGTNAGECVVPSGQNADHILGVTTHAQDQYRNVSIRKAGVARVEAAGVVAVGAPVNVADATGKVKAIANETTNTKVKVLGFAETASTGDGDIIEVFIALHERIAP
ncbi:MAG: DUF2190 family protein [Candidatus Sumerlaeota bacterium]|nr:DUF2190 family protein [Candidatus Sumerlaeota bacterium]